MIVTKVDNTSSSAPQVGLGSADLVVEELVEGGYTRLAAFYYSKVPANIGPVRSMRASDIGIVPEGATVVTSGAAPVTIKRINGAGIPWITEGAAGVYRETSRSAPYNLFAQLGDIAKRLKSDEEPPAYLPWGTEADLPKGGKAQHADRRLRRALDHAGRSSRAATSTPTPTPPRATSSPPTRCSCCGSRSATPATATPPATRCRRPSSRARAPRCSSTAVASSAAPGPRTA